VVTDLDDLRRHCRGLIADYEAPRSCEFVDSLPLSLIGKSLKRELRRRHSAGMGRQVR
jgi:acyl-CoA synthetase (AMP-forming)/AMP-acid ligase II